MINKATQRSSQRYSALLARIKHLSGLDRAIVFTILARGWSMMAGGATIIFIARLLTPSEQGYYYTFYSLVALQIVFELGFSFVILQLAAHESARLTLHASGEITGPEEAQSRLASVLQKSVRWYGVAAVLMGATLLPGGFWFFLSHQHGGGTANWKLPWTCAVIAVMFTFQMDPIFSFIEGCGMVADVAGLRLRQSVLGTAMAWTAFLTHHGLYAPAFLIGGQAVAGAFFLFARRRFLMPLLLRHTGAFFVSWQGEILPFQWRMAVSWICGYFIFQIFNPVLFAYRGAVVAGQMGMSLNICAALSSVAVSWIATKASPFGQLIAQRDFGTLDRLFFRSLLQSYILLASGAVILLSGYAVIEGQFPKLAGRILPFPLFAILLVTTLLNHAVFSEAIYLRAHKKEPFLALSVMVAILTGSSTLITAKTWGATGVSIGYLLGSGIFGVCFGTYIFQSCRRRWHSRMEESLSQLEQHQELT